MLCRVEVIIKKYLFHFLEIDLREMTRLNDTLVMTEIYLFLVSIFNQQDSNPGQLVGKRDHQLCAVSWHRRLTRVQGDLI